MRRLQFVSAILLLLGLLPHASYGQNSGQSPAGAPAAAPPSSVIDKTVEAGDDELPVPPPKPGKKFNEFDGSFSTLRYGGTLLLDFVGYSQDDANKKQVGSLSSDVGVRDVRFLLSGRFKKTSRPISWCFGYMYDGAADTWRVRQTGVDIGIPELSGHVFVGRVKEGYSMIKLMNGTSPWGMERTPALDFIPILADGVKWMSYLPKSRVFYSLGFFGDSLSEQQSFATYDNQVVSRVTWLPVFSEPDKRVLHVGVMGRVGKPDGGNLQIRSKPEANLAPYFLDTGKFAASRATTAGFESYFRKGPWLFGGEYNWERVDAADGQHPLFQGGNAVATWLITGETRAYNLQGSYFQAVSPKKSVFEHGPGAVEGMLNLSYADYDSGSLHGGKLVRLTPMVNWYLSDNLRLEFAYGYSVLDRVDLTGHTNFFQMRIQATL
jgi:phosphate-selective porin OprO/OprP